MTAFLQFLAFGLGISAICCLRPLRGHNVEELESAYLSDSPGLPASV